MKDPLLLTRFTFCGLMALPLLAVLTNSHAQQVTTISPNSNNLNTQPNTFISVTTDSPLSNSASLNVFSSQAGGKKTGNKQVVGSTVSFEPSAAFKPGERVQVTALGLNAAGLGYVFDFTIAAKAAPALFPGAFQVGIAGEPYSVATADLDGDGDLDIVTANRGDNVSIRFNDGKGNFSGTTQVGVGSDPRSVIAADVDGDGDLDILTANVNSYNVSVRFNDGSGNFSGTTQVRVGNGPFSVVAADVDGDGDLDILTANFGFNGNDVSVRLNDGSGNFSGTTQVGVGDSPNSVVAVDVDRDGDLDILTANTGSNDVSVRLNDGRGNFSGTTQVGVTGSPYSVASDDVDGDGDLDILTANIGSNSVSVRLNDGSGNFSGTTQVGVSNGPYSVATADLDGDGDLDILTANVGLSSNNVSIRLNGTTPLPVTLTSFTAQNQGHLVQLAWQTQLQTNFAGFQLERSLDAKEFVTLSWIPAQEIGAGSAVYGYNDSDLPLTANTLYYRLKVVDLDGANSYSAIRSVSLRDQQLGLLVQGNPVRGSLKLVISSPLTQPLQLCLISGAGQLVSQQTLSVEAGLNEWKQDLGQLGAGVYQLVLSDETHQRIQRLVVE